MLNALRHFEAVVMPKPDQNVADTIAAQRQSSGATLQYHGEDGAGRHIVRFTIDSLAEHPTNVNAIREAGFVSYEIHELLAQSN